MKKHLFGLIFIGVSTVFIIVGVVFLYNNYSFVQGAEQATGTFKEYITRSDSEGTTYAPVVAFVAEGENYEFTEQVSSSNRPYSEGDEIAVYYDPENPQKARIKSTFNLWVFPSIFLGMGLLFELIGIAALTHTMRRKKVIERLRASGQAIQAEFQQVGRANYSINGKKPFVIYAQALDPATNTIRTFKSDAIWFDPTDVVDPEAPIAVYVDPAKPKVHWMDTSFLPKHA